jgi:ribosomal protein L40E
MNFLIDIVAAILPSVYDAAKERLTGADVKRVEVIKSDTEKITKETQYGKSVRTCPYCLSDDIPVQATKCRYCASDLPMIEIDIDAIETVEIKIVDKECTSCGCVISQRAVKCSSCDSYQTAWGQPEM